MSIPSAKLSLLPDRMMAHSQNDSISCITVTQFPRLRTVQAAIADFCRQTYSARELILVVDDSECAVALDGILRAISAPIYLIHSEERRNLGSLRNLGVEYSHGSLICQWDDDDRYAPDRLALQSAALGDPCVVACFLYRQLHFFWDTRELFWTDWRFQDGHTVKSPLSRIIPGTVLCRRSGALYPEAGPFASRGEDSAFAAKLIERGAIGIETRPGTYLRTYHDANTWHREHHRNIVLRRSVPADLLSAYRNDIADALADFRIDSPVYLMTAQGCIATL